MPFIIMPVESSVFSTPNDDSGLLLAGVFKRYGGIPYYLKDWHGLSDELVKNISGIKNLVDKAIE